MQQVKVWMAPQWRMLTVLLMGLVLSTLAHATDVPPLFSAAVKKDTVSLAKRQLEQRAVQRVKIVSADLSAIDVHSGKAALAVSIDTFDGNTLIVDRERVEERAPGNYTWYGTVRGYGKSRAILTVVDGHMAGSIFLLDDALQTHGIYEVVPLSEGLHAFQEMNQSSYQIEEPAHLHAPQLNQLLGDGAVAADSAAIIDVMVVYSNQTAAAAGAGIGAQIQTAIDNTNQIYANSQISQRLRLAHYEQVNYDEHGSDVFGTALSELTGTSDGQMDNVHSLRNAFGADLVSLMIENGSYCGIAWIGPSASHGFNVVNRGCAISNSTFAHELGHNMGAMHDPYQVSVGGEGAGPFTYGYGYVSLAGRFRTVMAYDSQCNANGFSCTRIPYMSNPNITYSGLAVGSPQNDPTPTSNVARVLNETALTVANFRQAVSSLAPTTTTLGSSPNPATAGASVAFTATVSGSAGTGTVNFRDNGASISGCSAVPLAASVATCTTSALTVGTHSVVASYGGDASSSGSSSAAISQVVNSQTQTPVYQGYHDGADCSAIQGWAWDQRQPATAISVDVYIDGVLSSSVLANAFRADLLNAGVGNGSHGFVVQTPASAKDGQLHTIIVRFAGTGLNLSNTPQTIACASPTPPVSPLYQGNHDVADCQSISGWAWDQRQPAAAISVDILIDGATAASVPANAFRQDLLNAGIGNGVHAFSVSTPTSTQNGQPHVITVRFAGTSTNLSNTAKSITCGGPPPIQTRVYEGYFDVANCQFLAGWAWDQRQPTTAISVDISVDGALVASSPANAFRQDLLDAGKGNGAHGFVIATPSAVNDGRSHSLSVTFGGSGINTSNSPETLTCAAPS